jgi:ATP-dependent helicase/nuclease subunit A
MPAAHMMCLEEGRTLADVVLFVSREDADAGQPDKAKRFEELLRQAQAAEPADVYEGYACAQDIGVPSKLSVSALKRQAEKDVYRPVFVPAQTDDLTPAQRGTLTHRVLQHIGLAQRSPEDVRSLIGGLEQQGIIEKESSAHVDVEAICRFLMSAIAARARQAELCLVEQPFCLQMKASECGVKADSEEAVVIQGVIDLCFLENGKWVVVDYKTDAVTKQTAQNAAGKYAVQLALYAQALSRITRLPVSETYVYYLNAGMAVPVASTGE